MNATVLPSEGGGLRARVRALVDDARFNNAIVVVIVLNAITLGIETSPGMVERHGWWLHVVDRAALVVFVIELALRYFAHGLRLLRDPWGVFDTVIVGVALMPASGAFSVLRALRILRALRLISLVPSMRKVVTALLSALPGMASIIALLILLLYVSAVMATKLFSAVSPEFFGDLGKSLFTLFQVMTTEGWADIARELMLQAPWAWLFFVIYLLTCTFTVLNLFIAVVVSAMQSQVASDLKEDEEVHTQAILAEVRALRVEVRELRAASSGGA